MCDCEIADLIDLSIDEDIPRQQQFENSSIESHISENVSTIADCLISPPTERRESFDNNPFDRVQKLADRPKDPFDSVEMEACFKARHSTIAPAEIKMAKLLSLSDDNILDDSGSFNSRNTTTEHCVPKLGTDSTMASAGSTIYHSALAQDLQSESPPVSMSMRSTPDTGSSVPESGEGSASSAENSFKNRKGFEHRKRLLKLSISNSTFNSPVSRGTQRQSDSGFSTIFSEAALYSDHMLASESPLQLVDDDNMSETTSKGEQAERDFDADLEMMNIPILKELPSPKLVRKLSMSDLSSNAEKKGDDAALPGLAAIREKLRARRIEVNKDGGDVLGLIENLKLLICDNEVVDNNKKREANCLLEKLSSALVDGNDDMCNLAPPQPIVRQGTFDIDLQQNDVIKEEKERSVSKVSTETSHISTSTYSIQSVSPAKEIPEAMIKSSATYDGEPIAERENLLLPNIDTMSPVRSPTAQAASVIVTPGTSHPDLNDIIEQLGKLLEQHQHIQNDNLHLNGNGFDTEHSSIANPTFIVVMPTHTTPTVAASQSSIGGKSCTESNSNDEQSVLANCGLTMRRRSQSLSIHDKVKIVQLNMPQPLTSAPAGKLRTSIACPPIITVDTAPTDFKTPVRRMIRRNSYSSGTPYTPLTGATTSSSAANGRRIYGATATAPRYSASLATHQERETQQQPPVVRPLPHANLNSFKPDLKKKCKNSTAAGSIMKCSGPMKAVIPVKKVAPMLSSTVPAADGAKTNMDTSMHLLSKSGRISYTSTPMPSARCSNSATLAVGNGYPNACSTPALLATPVRRDSTVVKNPRFSTTPTSKQQSITAGRTMTGLNKRSLPELKAKSPLKSRLSLGSTGALTKGTGRSSLRPQPVITNPAHTRVSTRLITRASSGGAMLTNKENKQP